MSVLPSRFKFVFFALTAIHISACSSTNPDIPKEVLTKDEKKSQEIVKDSTEIDLLEKGKQYFGAKFFSMAKTQFDALRTGYPEGAFAEFAEIKSMDCSYEAGQYKEVAPIYEGFYKSHPTRGAAPYALYQAAYSYQRSHTGVGRDPKPLEKARELYQQFIKKFPNSPFFPAATKNLVEVESKLLEHQKTIKGFYERQENEGAVQSRDADIAAQEQSLLQTKSEFAKSITVAETRESNSDSDEGAPLSSVEAKAVVMAAASTPPAPEATRAPSTESTLESEAEEKIVEVADKPSPTPTPSLPAIRSKVDFVEKINCEKLPQRSFVIFFHEQQKALSIAKPLEEVSDEADRPTMLKLQLPLVLNNEKIKVACFGDSTLELGSRGDSLYLTGAGAAYAFSVDSPSRLIIVLTE